MAGNITISDDIYGDVGYFSKNNPKTRNYTYANWGSREWEYFYVEKLLTDINIENKIVVDVGIGLPTDSDFYKFYVKSNCNLTAIDPDSRLEDVTVLSDKCQILKKSAECIDMENDSVDVVVSISAFEHFPVEVFKRTIKEIHRVLRKDGHLVITLDLTFYKKSSAKWAILEKTMNGLPKYENNEQLQDHHQHLTLEHFLQFISPYFYLKNKTVYNDNLQINQLVYSEQGNSYVAYLHLYKNLNSPKKSRFTKVKELFQEHYGITDHIIHKTRKKNFFILS